MTREEAIEILCAYGVPQDEKGFREALDMAIEALKNEINCVKCEHYTERETPTGIKGVCKMDTAHREDLISRQDAVAYLAEHMTWYSEDGYEADEEEKDDVITDLVNGIPSADRPTEWIPCSERMPDAEYGEGDSVLCCTELGLMYILYWDGGNWRVPTGEPHIWVNHKTGWHDRVIAWLPLPTPYKGGESHD